MSTPSVLITAFEPFGEWRSNSSWQCLVQFTRELPLEPKITTRLYPVDFAEARTRLWRDLSSGYDFAIHLGQATGRAVIELEMFGLNIGGLPGEDPTKYQPLESDGPAAYCSKLPLADWVAKLRLRGIPAQVSHHAGAYLCNALLYWSQHFAAREGLPTQSTFVHIPLDPTQVVESNRSLPSLPTNIAATALRCVIGELAAPSNRLV